jgi:hypothetical protein
LWALSLNTLLKSKRYAVSLNVKGDAMINIMFDDDDDDDVVRKFPKKLVPSDYLQNFLERLRVETILR